jgi:hypothetical protein
MENKSTKLEDAILKKVLERLGTDKKDKPRRSEEYRLATKGIKSGKRKLFTTLFGGVGDWIDEFEEKASEEEVAEAKKKLKISGKKKRDKTQSPNKAISLILRNVLDIKKTITKIEKSFSSASIKAGFKFDPRVGTKGGFRNTETGKIVSKEEAMGGSSAPVDRLGAMISADEQPLVQLKEKFEEFEKKTTETLDQIKKKVGNVFFSLDGLTPTLGAMSVHDKLNIIMAKSALSGLDIDGKKKRVPSTKKPPGKAGGIRGALGKVGSTIGGAASKAGAAISGAGSAVVGAAGKIGAGAAGLVSKAASLPGVSTAAKVAGKVAVPLAVATTAYEAGKAGMNAEQTLGIQGREATAGETAAAAAGGAVEGLTFGLVSAKTVGTGLVSAGQAVSGTTSKLYNWATGKGGEDLNKVTTKQNSGVDTSNFEGGFEDRLAKMAAKFQEVTGNKLMITSGYRSEEKQKQLWDAKKAELTKAHPDWYAAQIDKAVGKLVARPVAYGGRGSRHNSGLAVDINSKGSAGIEAINGAEIGGQKVTTDSFLAKYGLFRPLKHEPWHIQPLGDKPTPDNPDPNAKPLVADATGKAMNLESGKTEAIPRAEVQAGMSAGLESPAPISGGAQIADTGGGTSTGGMTIPDSGQLATRPATDAGLNTRPATPPGLAPVQNQTGTQVAQQSAELASNQMTASMSKPAPVVINNTQSAQQQPIQPPKTPLPKASAVNNNNTYARAFAKDFSHPSAFTSVGLT